MLQVIAPVISETLIDEMEKKQKAKKRQAKSSENTDDPASFPCPIEIDL